MGYNRKKLLFYAGGLTPLTPFSPILTYNFVLTFLKHLYVPQIVLTSYSYHFPNVMMLAQVVITSVILEGGRLLGFSSMLKYTLERYYFAQWKGEVTGILLWVVVYKWGNFQAFLAVCTPKMRVPH